MSNSLVNGTLTDSAKKVENLLLANSSPNDLSDLNVNNRNLTQGSYRDFYFGLTLALLSSFFIGSSFILKKKGLLKLCGTTSLSNSKRAAQGGYGYLKEWLWWAGLVTMGVGELCNFAAYGFVPATLVTPLGALSVLISAVMSAYFLNEKLNTIGKIGCILTAIGSTVMVIHAPKEGEVKTVRELLLRIQDAEFISFTILSTIALLFLIFVLVPRYGNTNVLIYILICSILGSFTVMSCKGLSLGIKEIFLNRPSVSFLYTYMFAILVIVCIVIQMNYLNKSLDVFNTPIVTTVYYVLFTLFVMIASALLFKELLNVSFQDFVGCVCGFSTIVCALFLIQFFKTSNDYDLSTSDKLDSSSSSNNYDNNLFNMIINNAKQNAKLNDHIQSNNYLMTEIKTESETSNHQLDSNNSKQKLVANIPQESNVQYKKQHSQSSSDLVQSVTVFKIPEQANEVKQNSSSVPTMVTDAIKPTSLIKKLTSNYNIYKNLQNNYLFSKFSRNSTSGYNYNKLISDENYDFRDTNNDEDDVYSTTNIDDYDSQKNKKYILLNNNTLNSRMNDFELNYKLSNKNRKPVPRKEVKNISFDEKLFARDDSAGESDETNATSQSLIILKS